MKKNIIKILFLTLISINLNAIDYRNVLLNQTYNINGIFGKYDFIDGYSQGANAFDWAYVTINGGIYQLQGNEPSDSSVFGWKTRKDISADEVINAWYMFALGSDIDADGSEKFDWILVNINSSSKSVYKLAGVKADGTFDYSSKIEIDYQISNDKKSVIFEKNSSESSDNNSDDSPTPPTPPNFD